jgi:hypothetical protein
MLKNNFSTLAFQNEIMKRTGKAKKALLESAEIKKFQNRKSKVGSPTYRELLVENKMVNDGNFLLDLSNKYFAGSPERLKEFKDTIVESIVLFNKLHMEADIQPRLISPALNYDKAITESTKIEIYKKHFIADLTKNYSQPLLENKLFSKYEHETKLLLENVINAGVTDIDIDSFSKYALFESVMFDALRNILLPEYSRKEINYFIESQSPEYFTMFEENARVLYQSLNENIKKLTVALSPELYNESVGINFMTDPSQGSDGIKSTTLNNISTDELGATDNVGPIGYGKITTVTIDPSQTVTEFQPILKTDEDGFGLLDDAEDTNPDESGGLDDKDPTNENDEVSDDVDDIDDIDDVDGADTDATVDDDNDAANTADTYTDDSDDTLTFTDNNNNSTNVPNQSITPDVEIGKPYTPDNLPAVDNQPDDKGIVNIAEAMKAVADAALSKDATNVDQTTFDLYNDQMMAEPEEYISVPVEQSYTEESTRFNYRNFAGAMGIIRPLF